MAILVLSIVVVMFLIGSFLGYFIHKLLHLRSNNYIISKLVKSHKVHHTLYTIYDFQSERYRSAGKDASVYVFVPMISIVILVIATVIWWIFQMWWIFPIIIIEGAFIGFLNNYVHDAFHIKNHWLNNFSWFRRLRIKHWLHHLNEGTNYGIVWFLPDKVFNTYFK